jgi:hypothetical protein
MHELARQEERAQCEEQPYADLGNTAQIAVAQTGHADGMTDEDD